MQHNALYPDDHTDGGDCRRYAGAPVVRPHLCPERAWATCGAAFGDGNGEPSLQNTAGSVHHALDTLAVPVGSVQTL